MSEWHNIENVPRNGDFVDLISAIGQRWTDCYFCNGMWHRYGNSYQEYEIGPTHWMKVPDPPKV